MVSFSTGARYYNNFSRLGTAVALVIGSAAIPAVAWHQGNGFTNGSSSHSRGLANNSGFTHASAMGSNGLFSHHANALNNLGVEQGVVQTNGMWPFGQHNNNNFQNPMALQGMGAPMSPLGGAGMLNPLGQPMDGFNPWQHHHNNQNFNSINMAMPMMAPQVVPLPVPVYVPQPMMARRDRKGS
jgi:hypothetical protein